jgi:hypothetical protein
MVGEIFAGLGAIKTALDIVQGLKNLSAVTPASNRAIIELEEKLFAANKAQTALLNRVSELEKEVASFEKWDADKDRYELKKFGHGVARFIKPDAQPAELSHPVCANCFENRKKRFLQQVPTNTARQTLGMGSEWRCPECPTKI